MTCKSIVWSWILLPVLIPISIIASPIAPPDTKPLKNQLFFVENKNQITDESGKPRMDIDAKLHADGFVIFIGSGQLHYQWERLLYDNTDSAAIVTYRLDVSIEGAQPGVGPLMTEAQQYYENYYLSQCPEGVTARACKKIIYENIYPAIDWVLYTTNEGLKYDFIVHKGGNINDIKIKYNGATSLEITDGELIAKTPFGILKESKPYCYELQSGKEVTSAYRLQNNTLCFDVGEYNSAIVVDPKLQWATYYSFQGYADAVPATDNAGYVYLAGSTLSTTNIATTGAFQDTLYSLNSHLTAGYIAKFDTLGNRLWGTYYGSTFQLHVRAVKYTPSGHICITGQIMDPGGMIPTPGVHKTIPDATQRDAFLARFDEHGQRVWATYFGGEGYDEGYDIEYDIDGNIYLGGETRSTTNIATPQAYKTSKNVAQSPFVAKFDSSGGLLWSTYIDVVGSHEIACDGFNNVYVGGRELIKFSKDGTWQWQTDCGLKLNDVILGSGCDEKGNIYLGGFVFTSTDLSTPGSHQPTKGGMVDGFVTKVNPDGNVEWSTYYGGAKDDWVHGVDVNRAGNVYIYGISTSNTHIASPGGLKPVLTDSIDNFFAVFDRDGNRRFGTYFGGEELETSLGNVSWSNTGYVYIAGGTASPGIATPGALYTSFSGTGTASYLAAFKDTVVSLLLPFGHTTLCLEDTFSISYTVTYPFRPGNKFSVQLSDTNGSFLNNPTIIGNVTATTAGSILCEIPSSLSTGNKYRLRIVADAPHAISDDNGFDITISPLTAKPVITANTAVCEGDTLHLAADCPTPGVSYSWTGPNNFSEPSSRTLTFYPADSTGTGTYIVQVKLGQCPPKYDTVDVTVKPLPQPLTATYNNPIWEGQNLHLTAINNNAVSYVWSGPQDYTSGVQSPMRPNVTKGMAGMYTVVATKDGCSSTAWVTVVIDDYPDSCSFSYYPNPNKSIFTIKGCTISDEDIQYNIINSIGQIITRGTITPQNKYFNKTITLGQVANGVYFLRATIDRRINLPIIIIR